MHGAVLPSLGEDQSSRMGIRRRRSGDSAFPSSSLASRSSTGPWTLSAILIILALAAGLRLANLGHASFTHTEAWRANTTYQGSASEARRFPPLQFLLGRAIQRIIGRNEVPLRLPYAIGGILCVLGVYVLCARHVGKTEGLVAAALAMSHPVLVYYSRRQLEYSLEACASVWILWAALEVHRDPSIRRWLVFAGIGVLGLALTFTASLCLAACLLVLLSARLVSRNQEPMFSLAGVTSLLTVVGLGWYIWLAGVPDRETLIRYYDTVEVVWPTDGSPAPLAQWLIASTYGAMHFALGMSDTWAPLNWFLGTLFVLGLGAGIAPLWQQGRPFFWLLMVLAVATIAAGALRLWPFGNIRHATFLIPLVLIAVGCGLTRLIARLGTSLASILIVFACLVVPTVRAAKATVVAPTADEHIRPVFEYVLDRRQPGDAMFLYYFAEDAFRFYWRDTKMPVLVEPDSDRGDPSAFANRFHQWIADHRRVWFVFAHNWKSEHDQWLGRLLAKYQLLDAIELRDASAHLFVWESAGHGSGGTKSPDITHARIEPHFGPDACP